MSRATAQAAPRTALGILAALALTISFFGLSAPVFADHTVDLGASGTDQSGLCELDYFKVEDAETDLEEGTHTYTGTTKSGAGFWVTLTVTLDEDNEVDTIVVVDASHDIGSIVIKGGGGADNFAEVFPPFGTLTAPQGAISNIAFCGLTGGDGSPSQEPSTEPSQEPSTEPSQEPSTEPSQAPSEQPSEAPSEAPSEQPSEAPSEQPSEAPSEQPSEAPSEQPSEAPSEQPSEAPSEQPSEAPSEKPSEAPSEEASELPSAEVSEDASPSATGGVAGGNPTPTPGSLPDTAAGQSGQLPATALSLLMLGALGALVYVRLARQR